MKKQLIKYGLAVLAGGLALWGVLGLEGLGSADSAADRYRFLCDGFMVPGVLMLMLGALIRLSEEGAMDGVSWAMGNLVKSLIPGMSLKKEPYDEFVKRRHGDKSKGDVAFLFHVGAAFAAAGLVFLFLFYRVQ